MPVGKSAIEIVAGACDSCGSGAEAPNRGRDGVDIAWRFARVEMLTPVTPTSRAAQRSGARAHRPRPADRAEAEAVALWHSVVAGDWTIVEHFDSDGRRFIIARATSAARRGRAAPRLTRRERQVCARAALGESNKVIADCLRLSVSTVATLLSRAARRLGARSRLDLIRHWRASGRTRVGGGTR